MLLLAMPVATLRTLTASIPGTFEPTLCTSAAKAPSGDDWLHEIKLAGGRLLARKQGDSVRLHTRRGAEWSDHPPRLANAVRSIRATDASLDGEIVCVDDSGFPDSTHSIRLCGTRTSGVSCIKSSTCLGSMENRCSAFT
jgi:ATP-dependent DNA ligase